MTGARLIARAEGIWDILDSEDFIHLSKKSNDLIVSIKFALDGVAISMHPV